MTIARAVSICTGESCIDFADFDEDREGSIRELVRHKYGLPSHDIFHRPFRLIDPAPLAERYVAHLDCRNVTATRADAVVDQSLRADHPEALVGREEALH